MSWYLKSLYKSFEFYVKVDSSQFVKLSVCFEPKHKDRVSVFASLLLSWFCLTFFRVSLGAHAMTSG